MTAPSPTILAVGTALPGPAVDNGALAGRLRINREWIDTFIGTETRHFAVDLETGHRTHSLAELGEQAADQAMRRAGVVAGEIDFVVLASASPDELMPATVNQVADLLGLDQVPTYQLQSGCAGAMQALDLGCLLLGRPGHEVGLVIGGDVCAKHLRLDRDFAKMPSAELVNYLLFGDGVGAVVLGSRPVRGAMALRAVVNQFAGRGLPPGQVVRWFGAADLGGALVAAEEDYKAIEERVPVLADETLWQLLDLTGWDAGELSFLLPPQLSGRMTTLIMKYLDLPHVREISCVRETGNTGNALPFFQLDKLSGELGEGARAVAIGIESSKWIKSGFAVEGL